jgi:hypothetical protein
MNTRKNECEVKTTKEVKMMGRGKRKENNENGGWRS